MKLNPLDEPSEEQQPSVLYGVLVTFRRPETLRGTLDALAQQTRPLDQLVVVDNEPVDSNLRAVEGYRAAGLQASYLPMDDNIGPAGGYAAGIAKALDRAQASGSWVVLVDDDDPPRSETILEDMERFAIDTARRDQAVGAVGRGGSRFDLRRGRVDRVLDSELVGPVRIDSIANNMWPFYAAHALRAGGFEPELFFGFEELDLGLRLEGLGFHLYCNGPLMLEARRRNGRHGRHVRPRLRTSRPAWRRYYSVRNLIWILRSHGSVRGAIWVTLAMGIAKPIFGLVTFAPDSVVHVRLAMKACRDGWTGQLGRRVEPPEAYQPKVKLH